MIDISREDVVVLDGRTISLDTLRTALLVLSVELLARAQVEEPTCSPN